MMLVARGPGTRAALGALLALLAACPKPAAAFLLGPPASSLVHARPALGHALGHRPGARLVRSGGARMAAVPGEERATANALIRARLNQLQGEDAEACLREGLRALEDARAARLPLDAEDGNLVLYVVSRARNCSAALLDRALAALQQHGAAANTKTYNLLLGACKPRGQHARRPQHSDGREDDRDPLERTLVVLEMMERESIQRDDFSYTLIFSACARAARRNGARGLRLVQQFWREMLADGVEPSAFTLNAAIDVCAKASGAGGSLSACLEEAMLLFSYLQGDAGGESGQRRRRDGAGGPTAVTYTSLLQVSCLVLRSRVSTPDERARAFTVGLDCLAGLAGLRHAQGGRSGVEGGGGKRRSGGAARGAWGDGGSGEDGEHALDGGEQRHGCVRGGGARRARPDAPQGAVHQRARVLLLASLCRCVRRPLLLLLLLLLVVVVVVVHRHLLLFLLLWGHSVRGCQQCRKRRRRGRRRRKSAGGDV